MTETIENICPVCKGTGDAYRYNYKGYKTYWYPCPICGGKGINPKPEKLKQWQDDQNNQNKPAEKEIEIEEDKI